MVSTVETGARRRARRKPRRGVAMRLRPTTLALSGMAFLVLVASLSIVAPLLPLRAPDALNPAARLQPPFSRGAVLGTDDLGRDMLSRLVWGGRISLPAALGATLAAGVVGTGVGLTAGHYGGLVDHALMRATDVVLSFPTIVLAIAIVAGLGPGLTNAMIAVAIAGFPAYARLSHSMTLSLKEREFVAAACACGASDRRIVCRHLLPNVRDELIVLSSVDVGAKIIITSSLSFLGLGSQPPTADWGSMLAAGRNFVTVAPHVAALPGLVIFATVLSFNVLGDWVRNLLAPNAGRAIPTL